MCFFHSTCIVLVCTFGFPASRFIWRLFERAHFCVTKSVVTPVRTPVKIQRYNILHNIYQNIYTLYYELGLKTSSTLNNESFRTEYCIQVCVVHTDSLLPFTTHCIPSWIYSYSDSQPSRYISGGGRTRSVVQPLCERREAPPSIHIRHHTSQQYSILSNAINNSLYSFCYVSSVSLVVSSRECSRNLYSLPGLHVQLDLPETPGIFI